MPSSPEGGEALNAAARVPQNTADKWVSHALRIATSVNRNGFTGASQRGDGPVINEEDIDQVIQLKTIVNQMKYDRSEEHTSELQSLMRNSYAVFCLKKKNTKN